MIRQALSNIAEAGEAAGQLEIVKTPLPKAKAYGEKEFEKNKKDMGEELPGFDKNYERAQKGAKLGKTQRKDMPVIEIEDVKVFQARLEKGTIDINTPHPDDELNLSKDPFPQGLSGAQAKLFLKDGIKKMDGDADDDKVKVKLGKTAISDLKPIQKQIYFDKSIQATADFGAEGTRKFLTTKSILITSSDNYIIDGHHRWLSGNLIDPTMQVPTLSIDLPIKTLLPLSMAYGDAIGNKRNEDDMNEYDPRQAYYDRMTPAAKRGNARRAGSQYAGSLGGDDSNYREKQGGGKPDTSVAAPKRSRKWGKK